MTRTFSPKPADVQREWLVIDATDVVLGRLAAHAAALLRGKHKTTFAPHMDMGDHVIIVNADKVALTGSKLTQKMAYRHSGYPRGESHPRHAAEEYPGPRADVEAQGLHRRRAPSPSPAAQAFLHRPDRAVAPKLRTSYRG